MVIWLNTSWVVDVPMSMPTLRISGKGKITSRQKTKKGQDIPRKGCLSLFAVRYDAAPCCADYSFLKSKETWLPAPSERMVSRPWSRSCTVAWTIRSPKLPLAAPPGSKPAPSSDTVTVWYSSPAQRETVI